MPSSKTVEPSDSLPRRVANYATNLLVTGLILLVGLVFGSQVIAWWRVDEPLTGIDHVGAVVGEGLQFGPGWMHFGESTLAVHCHSLVGKQGSAFNALRDRCRQAAKAGPVFGHQSTNAEEQLLKRLDGKTPIEQQSNKWRMYQMSEGIPMVVLVGVQPSQDGSDSQFAEADSRVISLGMAFPRSGPDATEPEQWTLMVCADGPAPSSDVQWPQPPPPLGAQRILAVQDDQGNQMCSWTGTGSAELWCRSLDEWHASQGWKPVSDWSRLEQNRHRRYEHSTQRFADVQFTETASGMLSGYWSSQTK